MVDRTKVKGIHSTYNWGAPSYSRMGPYVFCCRLSWMIYMMYRWFIWFIDDVSIQNVFFVPWLCKITSGHGCSTHRLVPSDMRSGDYPNWLLGNWWLKTIYPQYVKFRTQSNCKCCKCCLKYIKNNWRTIIDFLLTIVKQYVFAIDNNWNKKQ